MRWFAVVAFVGSIWSVAAGAAAESFRPTCFEVSERLLHAESRRSYGAVEGAYAALRADRCPMGIDAHLAGGRASAMLGEPQEALARFALAGVSGAPEVTTIEGTFGRARVGPRIGRERLVPSASGSLVVDTRAPEKRATLERATLALERDGVYEGLLPVGRYELGGAVIVVRPLRGER